MRLRVPPKIKVLEAAGAIADGRVHMTRGLTPDRFDATVVSSEGDRRYRVVIVKDKEGFRVYSDDNGTKLRGYVGYPILSVLMLSGLLPRDPEVESALKGIDWRKLNETYKKYSVVEEIVLSEASQAVPRERIESFRKKVLAELSRANYLLDETLVKD
ncbi:MAG: hypothetical protein ACP5HK_00660 [Acidilobus sp.]